MASAYASIDIPATIERTWGSSPLLQISKRFGIAFGIAVNLSLLVIGGLYFQQCPIQPYIPIFMVVGGVFGLLHIPLSIRNDSEEYPCGFLKHLIDLFTFIWFIVGCVWVYVVYPAVQFSDPSASDYCHKTCFLFAFWFLNAIFIFLGVYVICLCAAFCLSTVISE